MEQPVMLRGADPVGFAVAVTIRDEYVDGSTREFQTKDFLRLGETYELAGERALRLPVRVEAAVEAVRRSVVVQVDRCRLRDAGGFRADRRVTAAITCTR